MQWAHNHHGNLDTAVCGLKRYNGTVVADAQVLMRRMTPCRVNQQAACNGNTVAPCEAGVDHPTRTMVSCRARYVLNTAILFTSTEEYTLTAVVSENDGCRALGDPAMVILSSCPLNRSPAHQIPPRSYRALHQQNQTISRRAEVHEIPRVPASIFRTRLLLVPLTVRLPPTPRSIVNARK